MKLFNATLVTLGLSMTFTGLAQADTLDNLERERAQMLSALTAVTITQDIRISEVEMAKRRLIDLERMVIRDDSILAKNTPTVRQAFANYDLTFLVHASTEAKHSVIDHWLAELGLNSDILMNTYRGRR